MTNPVQITLTQPAGGVITCFSSAADYFMQVTLTWSGTTLVFSGGPEGQPVPMTVDNSEWCPAPTSRQDVEVSALFQYTTDPGVGWTNCGTTSVVTSANGSYQTITVIGSADSQDLAFLTVTYFSLG